MNNRANYLAESADIVAAESVAIVLSVAIVEESADIVVVESVVAAPSSVFFDWQAVAREIIAIAKNAYFTRAFMSL